jgi:1-acyl-sn-glycerol-3-phosphate acyltransferase
MDERTPDMPASLFRGIHLALHLLYGMFLAIFYPHLNPTRQHRILKAWSRQLLGILNIGIYTEGPLPTRGEGGRMLVANHISWLDIFILNATCPSRFIAKSEVRDWPLIGWLCKRSGTIFVERDLRRNAASINRHVGTLLEQGVCIGLFPEGTTTDGKQLGHFHSALIQPAIDAGAMLYPIALHYRNEDGEPGHAAVFTGDMTLVQSIWEILRCRRLDALLVFAPALAAANGNRRVLARTAQEIIAQGLQQDIAASRQAVTQQTNSVIPQTLISTPSAIHAP